jgi:hypothetical protein
MLKAIFKDKTGGLGQYEITELKVEIYMKRKFKYVNFIS